LLCLPGSKFLTIPMITIAAGPLAWCAVEDMFRQSSGFGKFFLETIPRKKVKCNI
jgi:hypothetical protein